jgi:hypothetical protein
MALFKRNSGDPIAQFEKEFMELRGKRDRLAARSEKATRDLAEADRAQREALSGDDNEPAIAKIAGRRAVLVEIAAAAQAKDHRS